MSIAKCLTKLVLILTLGAVLVPTQPAQAISEDTGWGELRSLGKCLDVFGGDPVEGAQVVLWECHGGDNQQWRIEGDGPLKHLRGIGDLCLGSVRGDIFGNIVMALTSCEFGARRWTVSGEFPDNLYFVRSSSEECLDVLGSETENGTAVIPYECRGTPNQTWQFVERRNADSLPTLLLPYFTRALGFLTPQYVFAVRNDSEQSIDLRIDYYRIGDPLGQPIRQDTVPVEPKAVYTQSVESIYVTGQIFNSGYAAFTALDPRNGRPTPDQAISGDFFVFEPARNNAVGDRLVNLSANERGSTLCNRWQMRFLRGGGFSGGTTFTFWVQNSTGGNIPEVNGKFYDEAGNLFTEVQLVPGTNASVYTLPPLAATAGAVEWTFGDDAKGHVSGEFRAIGVLSVGMQATCLD